MQKDEFAFQLRSLASQAEVLTHAAPEIKDLPPGLTAGIIDAALRLTNLLSLLAREVELVTHSKATQAATRDLKRRPH